MNSIVGGRSLPPAAIRYRAVFDLGTGGQSLHLGDRIASDRPELNRRTVENLTYGNQEL